MEYSTITIIMISIIIILIINLGLNIRLLINKKTSEDFTVINKDTNTSSKSRDINYTKVAEFDQYVNMNPEVFNFSLELSSNQDLSKYIGAFIRIDGLSVPIAIKIRQRFLELIHPESYISYNSNIPSYPILKTGQENNFTLIYKNYNGNVIIELNNGKDLSFVSNLDSIIGEEKNPKKLSISFGSVQDTKWSL